MPFADTIAAEVSKYQGADADLVQLAPRLFKALANLLDEPGLDPSVRLQVAAALGYFAAPFDAVPDAEGGGWLDDVFVGLHVLRIARAQVGDGALDIAWPDQKYSPEALEDWYERTRAALHGHDGAALAFVGLS
jgi:uncharacterized membrane protein YkvA (DUF1232 family)